LIRVSLRGLNTCRIPGIEVIFRIERGNSNFEPAHFQTEGGHRRAGYHMREMRIANDRSGHLTGFGTRVFRELTGGPFVTLARSDLSRLLFEKVAARSHRPLLDTCSAGP
jgi:hypothetical protein